MKTPPFWYARQKKGLSAYLPELLTPLSWIFRAGGIVRRHFATVYKSRRPVVCVGNIVAGGAGKTPTALMLARLLTAHGHRPVFVTRGYGGTGQLTCVDLHRHTPTDVGDEALLLAAQAPTWACRDRGAAIRLAEGHGNIVIMDDGLQNPNVMKAASLLVIDGDAGLGNGNIIPAGPLRETFAEAQKRATAIILIGETDSQNLTARARLPVFRARLVPTLSPGFPRQGRFVAFAGIGRPEKFYATARNCGLDLADTVNFADHHIYTGADIQDLRLRAEEKGARLLTTEKDAVRLPQSFRDEVISLPVRLVFGGEGTETALYDLLSRCF